MYKREERFQKGKKQEQMFKWRETLAKKVERKEREVQESEEAESLESLTTRGSGEYRDGGEDDDENGDAKGWRRRCRWRGRL